MEIHKAGDTLITLGEVNNLLLRLEKMLQA
jgi:hypothetical protein